MAQWIAGFFIDGKGQPVSEIPWDKITHLYLCCGTAGPRGTVSEAALRPSSYAEIFATAQAAGVKVVLSLTDQGLQSSGWQANASPDTIDTFVANIKAYVNSHGFDGIGLDWEANVNTTQYIDLIARLRYAMPDKTITLDAGNWGGLDTVAAGSFLNLDHVNVMCYDMAGGHGFSWHNDALLQAGDNSASTCDWRMRSFTRSGIPVYKLGVGIPAYGYAWTGATGPRVPGASFNSDAIFYNQIVTNSMFWNSGLNKRWDDTYKADYLSVPATNQFITFNDVRSIHEIVNWGHAQGYVAYSIYTLEYEYIAGAVGDARFPLTTALYNEVRAATTPPTITSASSLPSAVAGTGYSMTLAGSGPTPITWKVSSGSLPAGLTLDPATATISGTPTVAGVFTFTIQASNGAGNNSKQFSLTVSPVFSANPGRVSFNIQAGLAPASQTVSVTSIGGPSGFQISAATADGGSWLVPAVQTGTTPAAISLSINTAGLTTGDYSGAVSVAVPGGSGLTIPVSVKVTGPAINSVTSAASLRAGPVAPGQMISLSGSILGPAAAAVMSADSSGLLGSSLAGVRVLFDGVPAPLSSVSSTQIVANVPYGVAGKPTTNVRVEYQGILSLGVDVPIAAAAPAIFTASSTGEGQGLILNQDFSSNSDSNPATAGSVVMIFATGEGQTDPPGVDGALTAEVPRSPLLPVSVTIGGRQAQVQYAGPLAGVAGMLQVNVLVPDGVEAGPAVPVVLTVGDASSQAAVTLALL
jgi:uncharacterized protein (TIGR03437 family)